MPALSTDEKTVAAANAGSVHEIALHCLTIGRVRPYIIRLPGDGTQKVAVLKDAIVEKMGYGRNSFELYMAKQEGRPDAPFIVSMSAEYMALRHASAPFSTGIKYVKKELWMDPARSINEYVPDDADRSRSFHVLVDNPGVCTDLVRRGRVYLHELGNVTPCAKATVAIVERRD